MATRMESQAVLIDYEPCRTVNSCVSLLSGVLMQVSNTSGGRELLKLEQKALLWDAGNKCETTQKQPQNWYHWFMWV